MVTSQMMHLISESANGTATCTYTRIDDDMDGFTCSFEKQQMVLSIDWRKWDIVYRYSFFGQQGQATAL